ncbi:TetR/AcrR family transcriptional regulator [Sphingomonas sp. DT-204]|uniref:TetR/AcrR family transcriptional regulator n=1 Tax=Sphingomonas sp. DT-204 TaxID=3396166 RepID=UPI003F1AF319
MVQKTSGRPRGRPRSFDPDRALAAATERFRTRGYAGTSLDELADATGLNRPSLYSAFGDKRALYLAALERIHARAMRGFDRLAEQRLPLRPMLETMFRVIIDGYLTGEDRPSGCVFISTAATAAVADEEVRAQLAGFLAMEDERIERLLADAGDEHARTHAPVIAGIVHSLSVRARAGAPKEELDALARNAIDLIA